MFLFPPKRPKRVHLERQLAHEDIGDQFTGEEAARIIALRRQFMKCPESLKLDLSYHRLLFARWLIQHGYLSESLEVPHGTRSVPHTHHSLITM